MPRGNPRPVQTEEFKSKQFRPAGAIPGDYPLAKKPIAIKLPIDVDDAIRKLPEDERTTWLRQLICNAARAELIEN